MNCGESNALELYGDGGIILSTCSESGDDSGDVDIYADNLRLNGQRVLTSSQEDMDFIRYELGIL